MTHALDVAVLKAYVAAFKAAHPTDRVPRIKTTPFTGWFSSQGNGGPRDDLRIDRKTLIAMTERLTTERTDQ